MKFNFFPFLLVSILLAFLGCTSPTSSGTEEDTDENPSTELILADELVDEIGTYLADQQPVQSIARLALSDSSIDALEDYIKAELVENGLYDSSVLDILTSAIITAVSEYLSDNNSEDSDKVEMQSLVAESLILSSGKTGREENFSEGVDLEEVVGIIAEKSVEVLVSGVSETQVASDSISSIVTDIINVSQNTDAVVSNPDLHDSIISTTVSQITIELTENPETVSMISNVLIGVVEAVAADSADGIDEEVIQSAMEEVVSIAASAETSDDQTVSGIIEEVSTYIEDNSTTLGESVEEIADAVSVGLFNQILGTYTATITPDNPYYEVMSRVKTFEMTETQFVVVYGQEENPDINLIGDIRDQMIGENSVTVLVYWTDHPYANDTWMVVRFVSLLGNKLDIEASEEYPTEAEARAAMNNFTTKYYFTGNRM